MPDVFSYTYTMLTSVVYKHNYKTASAKNIKLSVGKMVKDSASV